MAYRYVKQIEDMEQMDNLTFGQALHAVGEGRMIARSGWNGKGLFVFKQVPATITADIIPKMQSLPQLVKDEFAKRGAEFIDYFDQLALVSPDNTIQGWAPSTPDALADDWMIVNED